jgi:hypothetical protein
MNTPILRRSMLLWILFLTCVWPSIRKRHHEILHCPSFVSAFAPKCLMCTCTLQILRVNVTALDIESGYDVLQIMSTSRPFFGRGRNGPSDSRRFVFLPHFSPPPFCDIGQNLFKNTCFRAGSRARRDDGQDSEQDKRRSRGDDGQNSLVDQLVANLTGSFPSSTTLPAGMGWVSFDIFDYETPVLPGTNLCASILEMIYVYMHVHMLACMYGCMYVCIDVWMDECMDRIRGI